MSPSERRGLIAPQNARYESDLPASKEVGVTPVLAQQVIMLDGPPDPDLVRIRDLVYHAAGIFHPDTKLGLLFDCCRRRMKELNAHSLREYFECLSIRPDRHAELLALLNEITIGETCFFRNPPQIDALREVVIPNIVEAKAKLPLRQIRIWSAGCSTGEEPYTLSMVFLEESQRHLKDWIFEILATDLNGGSLAHAKKALYGSYSTRHLPAFYRQKYFTAAGEHLQLNQPPRNYINFSCPNLADDALMISIPRMDIIFCCNVLIYFDLASKRRVLRHFYNNLLPHGYLFLGPSESLYGVTKDFQLVHLPGATAYIKTELGKQTP
jgi:chemotaxis protein methyltransferase CheR